MYQEVATKTEYEIMYNELIKNISIRGRVAFAIKSLELNIMEVNNNVILNKIIIFLKEYTSTKFLDQWDKYANEISPDTILDPNIDNNYKEYECLTEKEALSLKYLYESAPKYIIDIIDFVIEIGTCNLYGGTGEYSPISYNKTMGLINYLKENQLKIPLISNFIQFKYTQINVWGETFIYDLMIKNG